MEKSQLRDKVDSLKFKLNREDRHERLSHNSYIAFASISLVLFIFELGKDEKSIFLIVALGIIFLALMYMLTGDYFFKKSKIESEINKIYRKLLK